MRYPIAVNGTAGVGGQIIAQDMDGPAGRGGSVKGVA